MTDETGQLRERIAVLEANYRHAIEKIEHMAEQMDEIHSLLLRARGARWALISIVAAIGFIIGVAANIRPIGQWLGIFR